MPRIDRPQVLVQEKRIDPSFVITDRVPLTQAPKAYKKFSERRDGCIKVVLKPNE